MAGALVGVATQNLISLLERDFSILGIEGIEIALKLSSMLCAIQGVLEDAEEMQIEDKSTTVWLKTLKHAIYDANDVVEELSFKIQSSTNQVSRSFSSALNPNNVKLRHTIGKKISEIVSKFDEIATERLQFHHSPIGRFRSESQFTKTETTSMTTEPDIYGRHENKKELINNLVNHLKRNFSQIKGVEKDVEKLVRILCTIQAVLEDAEERQSKVEPFVNWLRRLKHAIYDANDVIDALSLKIQSSKSLVSSSLSATLNPNNIKLRHTIGKKIKEILSKFVEIANEKSQFHVKTDVVSHSESRFMERETSSMINEPRIYGRDETKMNIIAMLVNDFVSRENVSICPIVGMGGLGKTTLAQSIYNDQSVQRHFQVKIWVCISEIFDVKRVLKTIVESSHKNICDFVTLESLRREVPKILREKRYLIVFDDVWNEDQDKWNILKSFLEGGAKGSSVLLTTRSLTVASITGTVQPYLLGALSDDHCFSLFMNHAVGDRSAEEEEHHPNLARIGMEISVKCKGIPLVAKFLGSLLRFKTDEKQWELVRDSEIRSLSGGQNIMLTVLRLSYNHLSPCLKQCFSYCSIFQKNFKLQKTKLVYLWIANGFILSQGDKELEDVGDKELEDVGDDVFNGLLQRSLFQVATRDNFGNIESCKLHDLMHELACSVENDECLIVKVSQTEHVPKTIRHLSVVCDSQESPTHVDHVLSSQPSLYTLFFFNPVDFFGFQFPSTLRVLNLCEMKIHMLPDSVCDLKYLRYLDLSGNLLTSLPESIRKLRNLQMLDLARNSEITTLPLSICELKDLRYLGISECYMLNKMPVGVGRLRNLTTLAEFVVGISSDGNNEGGLDISELKDLNKLRGGLKIKGLENVRNGEHAIQANLESKRFLTRLQLIWEADDSLQVNNSSEVLQGLQLPLNLQELEICNYKWETSFPERFFKDLNHLRSVEINFCRKLRSLPRELENLKALTSLTISGCHELVSLEGLLQKLMSIETLKIWSCSGLKSLGTMGIPGGLNPNSSSSHLQLSLQKLEISDCPELVLPEDGFQHFNALHHLSLEDLPKLTVLPQGIQHLSMLQSIEILRCSNLRMLPEWMRRLTDLRSLEIIYCHEGLHKRCERENGEDWPFISHIPYCVIR